jgi:hypothetical protein
MDKEWIAFNKQEQTALVPPPTSKYPGVQFIHAPILDAFIDSLPTNVLWPAELNEMLMRKGHPLEDSEARSLSELVWLLNCKDSLGPMCRWLKERGRFRSTEQLADMSGHYLALERRMDSIPYQRRSEARRAIRAMTIELFERNIFNPWARNLANSTSSNFLFDHCKQSHWASNVPVFHDLGFRYFTVKPPEAPYLRDLIKNRRSFREGLVDECQTAVNDAAAKLREATRQLSVSQSALDRMTKEVITYQERVTALQLEYNELNNRLTELKNF